MWIERPVAKMLFSIFFFNATSTTEIYTLSLHDALPIFLGDVVDDDLVEVVAAQVRIAVGGFHFKDAVADVQDRDVEGAAAQVEDRDLLVLLLFQRSEEHTSELQSPCNLVCRLLLEKKKK